MDPIFYKSLLSLAVGCALLLVGVLLDRTENEPAADLS